MKNGYRWLRGIIMILFLALCGSSLIALTFLLLQWMVSLLK